MSLIKYILKENTAVVADMFKKIINHYSDNLHMSCEDMNSGECEHIAISVYKHLKDKGVKSEILSDALFHDQFGDEDPDLLLNPEDYSNKVPDEFQEKGLPAHYWIYYQGKHYDVEVPTGVRDLFDIPIFKRHYQ